MRFRFWLLLVLVTGCDGRVYPTEMEACKELCAPRPVSKVTAYSCECEPTP